MIKLDIAYQIYKNDDINNPKYLFHGRRKLLDKIEPQEPVRNKTSNPEDTVTAIYGSAKINGAIPYSISIESEYDEWYGTELLHYFVPPEHDYEVAVIEYGEIDERAIGYIYVFDASAFKKSNEYQWISTETQIPIETIEVSYEEVKNHFIFPHQKSM